MSRVVLPIFAGVMAGAGAYHFIQLQWAADQSMLKGQVEQLQRDLNKSVSDDRVLFAPCAMNAK